VPAAGAAVPAGNPGGPPAVALDTSGGGAQPAVQEEALQEMSPGQVIPLGESTHPLIGQDAIDVTGVTLDGKKIKLSDYRGKPVMLNFWATWCPPCRAEMPFMQEAYSKFKSQGFEILAVNAGEKVGADQVEATVKGFVTDHAFTFPIMLADDTYGSQARYYVSSLPSTFLVDAEGKVRDSHRGMYPNRATLEDQLVRRFSFKAATN
jgi:thiol-disulfide isomerase/thioredoxin